jgi:hypothetical protein
MNLGHLEDRPWTDLDVLLAYARSGRINRCVPDYEDVSQH